MPLYDVILYVLLLALAIAVIAAMFAGAMALKQENPFSWPVIVGLAMIGFLITRPVEYQPGPLDRAIAASLAPTPKRPGGGTGSFDDMDDDIFRYTQPFASASMFDDPMLRKHQRSF